MYEESPQRLILNNFRINKACFSETAFRFFWLLPFCFRYAGKVEGILTGFNGRVKRVACYASVLLPLCFRYPRIFDDLIFNGRVNGISRVLGGAGNLPPPHTPQPGPLTCVWMGSFWGWPGPQIGPRAPTRLNGRICFRSASVITQPQATRQLRFLRGRPSS